MPYFADRATPVELQQSIPLSTATQRELKSLVRACKKSVGASAWHEAAHAVVGVRLGLTLHSIDIRVRVLHDHEGNAAVSSGFTSYRADDLAERFGVVGAHRACAVFAAAGIAAEEARPTDDTARRCAVTRAFSRASRRRMRRSVPSRCASVRRFTTSSSARIRTI